MLLFLKHTDNPENYSVNYACRSTVNYYGARYIKHFYTCAYYKSFAFELHGGRDYGVCKAGNGNEGSGAGMACYIIVKTAGGRKGRKKNEGYCRDRFCRLGFYSGRYKKIGKYLPEQADGSAHKKGAYAVL